MIAWRRVFAITRKEIQVLFARPLERRIIVISPIAMMLIFSLAATREVRNVDVAILDRDRGVWSLEVRQRLQGSPVFQHVYDVEDMRGVQEALDNQQALLALVFAEDFSRHLAAGQAAPVQVLLDGRRANAAQVTQSYLIRLFADISQQIAQVNAQTLPEGMSKPAQGRMRLEVINWFNPNLEFRWFYLPTLIGLLTMMMGFVITGLSVARERELGTFDQMLVSPAEALEVAIGKLIPGSLVAMAHGTIFVVGIHLFFHVPLEGSLGLIYLSLFIFAMASNAMGLMISSLTSSQQQAFLGCFTVAVPLILLSGYAAPVDNMPEFLQNLSQFDPLRHFLFIIQGLFLKNMTFEQAWPSLFKMAAQAVVMTVAAIILFRKRA